MSRKKITESIEVKLIDNKLSHDIDLIGYIGILQIVNELKAAKFNTVGSWQEGYHYKNPPEWSE